MGIFPPNLALIHLAVSEKKMSTDGRTDNGRPSHGSSSAVQ